MESDTFWLSVLLKRAWSFQELMFQFGKVAKMEMFVKLIMIYCYSLFNKLDWNIKRIFNFYFDMLQNIDSYNLDFCSHALV